MTGKKERETRSRHLSIIVSIKVEVNIKRERNYTQHSNPTTLALVIVAVRQGLLMKDALSDKTSQNGPAVEMNMSINYIFDGLLQTGRGEEKAKKQTLNIIKTGNAV